MNQLDRKFQGALRAALVAHVSAAPSRTRRRRVWAGAGLLSGVGLLGGVAAAASGLWVVPGADIVTPLADAVTVTRSGTATVELGEVPPGATGVSLSLSCLSAGTFTFDDGASSRCSAADVGTRSAWTGYRQELARGQHTVTIKAGPGEQWRLTITYVNAVTSPWGVNAKGETYGVENAKGSPVLIAVVATNGVVGYAYSKDLSPEPDFKSPEEALAWQSAHAGTYVEIPVYGSDGETKVGVFRIGG
ncbi:peptidase M56 family protein [Arthrobacter livingstonensis]|uniref:Peptidase M56 family protein n=1 Tax=Arthrobacter livingstonensis TaxID=670078 RepID=A0A2V5LZ93_9MICC|nr:peptidase M56 family protein [Arthrobacter livingstonensis]PYI67926.1 peptidase M56 family protein [Arthrobacter livingstonensis]